MGIFRLVVKVCFLRYWRRVFVCGSLEVVGRRRREVFGVSIVFVIFGII